jgi:Leucine-rich repeat (LRR) protein
MSSTGNTITIAHNASASGTRKTIYCPGDTSYALAPHEAVTLIYDAVNTIWIIFGRDITSSADNLGNHTATTNLDMSGNQIQKITTAYFNGDIDNAHFIAGNTGGLDYNVDNTDEVHDLGVDGVVKLRIGNDLINSYVALDVAGDLTTSGELILTDSGNPTATNTSITSYTGDMNYNAITNDSHFFRINGTVEVEIDADGLDIRNGWLELEERTAPSGLSNHSRLYAKDNGSGKTQLVVIFGSGVEQVIATEP